MAINRDTAHKICFNEPTYHSCGNGAAGMESVAKAFVQVWLGIKQERHSFSFYIWTRDTALVARLHIVSESRSGKSQRHCRLTVLGAVWCTQEEVPQNSGCMETYLCFEKLTKLTMEAVVLAPGKWKWEDGEFKVILSFIMRSRPNQLCESLSQKQKQLRAWWMLETSFTSYSLYFNTNVAVKIPLSTPSRYEHFMFSFYVRKEKQGLVIYFALST